eukprot:5784920-Alexandrium_andersonii.AAC.1
MPLRCCRARPAPQGHTGMAVRRRDGSCPNLPLAGLLRSAPSLGAAPSSRPRTHSARPRKVMPDPALPRTRQRGGAASNVLRRTEPI